MTSTAPIQPAGTTRQVINLRLVLTWEHSRFQHVLLFVLSSLALLALAALSDTPSVLLILLVATAFFLVNPSVASPIYGHGRNSLVVDHGLLTIKISGVRRPISFETSSIQIVRVDSARQLLTVVSRDTTIQLPAIFPVATWLQYEIEQAKQDHLSPARDS